MSRPDLRLTTDPIKDVAESEDSASRPATGKFSIDVGKVQRETQSQDGKKDHPSLGSHKTEQDHLAITSGSQTKRSVIDVPDNSTQNPALRDALIKSFMVIFTNEKSQHLLLNKDIIDIAFNCLEFCDTISIDAKRNLARLISIIFKFPQVQDRILQEKIIRGVVHLLQQDLD